MSRTLWFAAGAGASVYAMNRLRRLREAATVDGLRDRAGAAALGLRLLRDEVAQGRVEKETELRERLGLVPDSTPQLEAAARRPMAIAPDPTHPETTTHETNERGSS